MPSVSWRGLLGRALAAGDVTLDALGVADEPLVVAAVLVGATVGWAAELGEAGLVPGSVALAGGVEAVDC